MKLLTLTLCAALLAASASASTLGRDAPGHSADGTGPILYLVSLPASVVTAPFRWIAPKPGTRIHRDAGWTTVGFPLQERGQGLYLEVGGKTQIDRVEIVYEGGDMEQIELGGNRIYDRGLYELRAFPSERQVLLVRMKARAWSSRARMQVLLRRDG
jgi:hypothetical protein